MGTDWHCLRKAFSGIEGMRLLNKRSQNVELYNCYLKYLSRRQLNYHVIMAVPQELFTPAVHYTFSQQESSFTR